ncbi:casp-like protein 2b1 [Quercus suber]|uniref:CASP-like protein n=1 Tax=Quercus suber TaxID=58331 RepID=A0AAW0KZU9_QUESU
MSYLGVGISPGNVPVSHSMNVKVVDRRVRVAELVLRCVICGLGVLAAVLVGLIPSFLVIANGIAAAYSLMQVLRCVVSMIRGHVLFSKPLAWAIFSGDQVMAYVTVAAVASTAQSAVISKLGQPELQWMKICNMYGKYCNQIGEGIASALLVSLSMVAISCMSAFSLFRLYGGNKGKGSPRNKLRLGFYMYSCVKSVLVMAYVTVAAVASTAQSAVISKLGQPELQWMKICNMYGKYCNQIGEGIASALLVSLSMVAISCMSAFSLFRLYGGNKGKGSPR